MRGIQCWARLPDGTRCGCQVLPGRYFCAQHGRMGCHQDPSLIFLAPVAEMPGDLVDQIRAADPDAVFPEPSPVSVPEPEPPLPPPFAPAPEQHSHCRPTPGAAAGALEAGPDRAAAQPEAPLDGRVREPDGAPLDWLLDLLKAAMTGVMACDSPPLQKANAVARLGNLYLKAHGAAELKRENARLRQRLAELEQRRAAVETPRRDEAAGSQSSPGEVSPRVHPASVSGTNQPAARASSPAPIGSADCASPAPSANAATVPNRQPGSSPPHKPGRSGGGRRR